MRFWKGMFAYSSSADTPSAAQVTIGASKDAEGLYVQTLSAGIKSHIAGPNYPMYGVQPKVSKSSNPRVQMKHLSALVALKVVNQGDGIQDNGDESIIVKDLTFSVPQITSKQTQLPIIGAFTVNTTGSKVTASNFTPVSGSSSNIVTLKLTESVTIPSGGEATFYIAVRPFNESSITRTVTDPILEVTINGSKRQVSIPSAKANFEAGTITTLRVPVKLSYPKSSDAMTVTGSQGDKVLTFPVSEQDLNVNGEIVKAYVVGDGEFQELRVIGTTTDIVNALDVGFYASTWQGKRAAMTVSNVNVWMPNSDGSLSKIKDYGPLKNILTSEIKDDLGWAGFLAGAAVDVVMGTLSNGIPRDDQGTLSFIYLTKFIDPQTITFNGVVENGSAGSNEAMLFLDESPIYKEIKAETVNALLSTRFSYNGQIPTYAGLLDIINGKNTTEANTTAEVLYNKLYDVVAGKGSLSMSAVGVDFTINLANVFNALISDANDLKAKLPKMKFQIDVSTCPYKAKKTDYGSKSNPITLATMKTWEESPNPIVFWGLDMYGPEFSTPQK